MIDVVAFIDTETTGLDPTTSVVIEVGCALYSVRTATMLSCWSVLLAHDTNEAEAVNHISPETLKAYGSDRTKVLPALTGRLARAELCLAHRSDFDRAFLPDLGKPWLCTKFACKFPRSKLGDHLVNVALAHGVPVHDNHRAMTDVMLLVRTFQRVAEMGYDVQAMLADAMLPRELYQSLAGYDRNEETKAHGFAWEPAPAKRWTRRLTPTEAAALPFPVKQVSP